jgi:hypothetical protein
MCYIGGFKNASQISADIQTKNFLTTILQNLSMALQSFVGPLLLFQFLDHLQSLGLLGQGISLSQSHYLHTGQHKHRRRTYIHASNGIRTHNPTVSAGGESSFLRPCGHCNRQSYRTNNSKTFTADMLLLPMHHSHSSYHL